MTAFFYGCVSLTSIDLSKINASNLKNIDYMFYQCSSLSSINLENFKALNVKNTIIKPFGNKVLLFDNTTPEGRALSRTVRVEIKTMLK